ncbi:tRNA threonylcarbamoyladenosine dehydratase [Lachnotalea sp. AF33-28]|jgi:tRNA A37 threonylcarbamoyladenosine dehydratase|uniref:tRNA threonylcarbamoyladenosine dehydratase n=1 Tax=Lachnotalea sp. AF33-28 TaxID=2292046 RepID=UPI000E4B11F9|nr:tRNA threonylcarbamoyladenosine dehydratase [Lachnotalea sp. AF33-28]RHP31239.1 tRNA threonylcarbamoyladenosine dehydratase [Lachnotalea sp. AF33-28]
MINEFSRSELLLGPDSMNRLKNTTIALFGIGGVGSHCAEALARAGIGTLILVDNDRVSLTNINRQSIAYHSTVGCYKTDLMKQRIADINPNARVITFETFVLPENIDEVLPEGIDYIIDAIDTVSAKLALAQAAWQRQTPIISCMGTGNKLHAQLFEIADIYETSVCPLCRVMRKELKARGIPRLKVLYSREQPLPARIMSEENTSKRAVPGSVSFVPPVAGLLIAGEAIRDVLNIPSCGKPAL